MSNDEAWMMMLLLLCYAQNNEFNIYDMLNQEKADTQYVNNCSNVEWE